MRVVSKILRLPARTFFDPCQISTTPDEKTQENQAKLIKSIKKSLKMKMGRDGAWASFESTSTTECDGMLREKCMVHKSFKKIQKLSHNAVNSALLDSSH